MHVKITYPSIERGSRNRRLLLDILRWPFILAAVVSVIVNLCVGGPLWCVVASIGLSAIWKLLLSIDLVEYNRTSQFIKTVVWSCILLASVDILLVHGWSRFVLPIVLFGAHAICAVLFFTDIETQKHNMMPLILFIFASIVGSVVVLHFWHEQNDWPYMVLLGLSAVFLLTLILVLRQDFLREMKRRFHVK